MILYKVMRTMIFISAMDIFFEKIAKNMANKIVLNVNHVKKDDCFSSISKKSRVYRNCKIQGITPYKNEDLAVVTFTYERDRATVRTFMIDKYKEPLAEFCV
jgi:hypothetical protein